jgi:hypothetical protein
LVQQQINQGESSKSQCNSTSTVGGTAFQDTSNQTVREIFKSWYPVKEIKIHKRYTSSTLLTYGLEGQSSITGKDVGTL